MLLRRLLSLTLMLVLLVQGSVWTAPPTIADSITPALFSYAGNSGFVHETGRHNPYGWQADYRISQPGYLVRGLSNGGDLLPEGEYRYDLYIGLRSGHLAGLLSAANDVIRVEAYDATAKERVMDRTFQMADFPSTRRGLGCLTLTFSTRGRHNHRWEPRIYWQGLAGLYLEKVDVYALESSSLTQLIDKALSFEKLMNEQFIQDGYVVVRSDKGEPEDYGDTAIWTGLYAAAEAWRFQATRSQEARARMERALWAMHALHAQAPNPETIVRHVDSQGHVLPDAPSKDSYTGFFFALGQCMTWVRDPALRQALTDDAATLTDALITQNLMLFSPFGYPVTVSPSLSPTFLMEALHELKDNPAEAKRWIHLLGALRWYFWLHGQLPVPLFAKLLRALRHPTLPVDTSLAPALNDAVAILRQLQRNVHHSAAMGVAGGLIDAPYAKIDLLLLQIIKKIDDETHRQPLRGAEDLKILPSEALHALHWIKVTSELLPKPNRFDLYYQNNLSTHNALLRTVVDWSHIDELLLGAALGETRASAMRTSSCHLTFLALYDLILLEKDPWIRFQYQTVFERELAPMRSDYNAMLWTMQDKLGLSPHQPGLALWTLSRYPQDRRGRGDNYWRAHEAELLKVFGGPVVGKAREPLPPDVRPRDAFLWQRSARSIRGDSEGWEYPPMDFLFAYWMARTPIGLDTSKISIDRPSE